MQAGINLNKIIGLVIRSKFKITKILLMICILIIIISCKIQKNPYAACELLRTKNQFAESISCYQKMDLSQIETIKNIGLTYFYQADFERNLSDNITSKEVTFLLKKSAAWYEQAASKGDAQSEFLLGIIYGKLLPIGERDINKSIEFFTRSANKEYIPAQIEMGIYYYYLGVATQNQSYFMKSVSYFQKANTDEAKQWVEILRKEHRIP